MTGGGASPSRRWAFVLVGGVVCLIAIWFFWRGRQHEAAAPPADDEAPAPVARVEAPRLPPPRPARAAPPPAAAEDEVTTSDGLPIAPAHEGDPRPEGPMHPHPITPQHVRLYAENRLVGELSGAMDVKDAPGIRRLLEQYRREYPEDDNMLQDGYALIADCFEHPGPATREAAVRWIESHNGSILKRFVYRHCLEPQ